MNLFGVNREELNEAKATILEIKLIERKLKARERIRLEKAKKIC